MYLIFKSRFIADALLSEICVTPFDNVILWTVYRDPMFWFKEFNPDGSIPDAFDEGGFACGLTEGADGRCAVGHPFSESDIGWLEAYLDTQIASGDVALSEVMPSDWKYPMEG